MPEIFPVRVRSWCFHSILVMSACFLLFPLALSLPLSLQAQDKNPFAGDANAAKVGESQFRANCAFCHGLGARGGGRGPDLTRVQKKHGNADGDLYRTINEGVPGTAMPPNGATQQGVGMTEAEIWQVITYIRSVQKKTPAAVVGDAAHGRELFYGSAACSTCHMVQGKGGRLGPDLTGVAAARSNDYLVESLRNPSRRLAQGISEAMKEFSEQYETVTVVDGSGQKFQGVVLNEDNFTLQMIDMREQLHLFEKDKVRSVTKSRESLMPVYDQDGLPEKDLQDLIAFLQSVETGAGGGQ
jgi:cytochrome c oxidase cbb3-type subunit III